MKVPWAEGACGATAIVLKSGADDITGNCFTSAINCATSVKVLIFFLEKQREELFNACSENMPSYQRPIFIRVQPDMEVTGTFKHRKVELVKEGYEISKFSEKLYFYSKSDKNYIPVTQAMVDDINSGKLKF